MERVHSACRWLASSTHQPSANQSYSCNSTECRHAINQSQTMTKLQILLVKEPVRAAALATDEILRKRPDRFGNFCDALGAHAGSAVHVATQSLCDVVKQYPDAYILLSTHRHPREALRECSIDVQARVAARVVALEQDGPRVAEDVLEPLSIAGAIDTWSLMTWKESYWNRNDADHWKQAIGTIGFLGLAGVGAGVGARCHPGDSRYCYLSGPLHEGGLPHLMVDYLRALAFRNALSIGVAK